MVSSSTQLMRMPLLAQPALSYQWQRGVAGVDSRFDAWGRPLVFRFYALLNLAAAACIGTFSVLEMRNPLLRSPLEPRGRSE